MLHRITKYPLLLGELKKCTKDENNPDFHKLSENIKLAKVRVCMFVRKFLIKRETCFRNNVKCNSSMLADGLLKNEFPIYLNYRVTDLFK